MNKYNNFVYIFYVGTYAIIVRYAPRKENTSFQSAYIQAKLYTLLSRCAIYYLIARNPEYFFKIRHEQVFVCSLQPTAELY